MRINRMAFLLIVAGSVAGCSSPTSAVCTSELRTTVYVSVVDSVSNTPIASGVTGTITDGAFTAQLQGGGGSLVYQQEERPGTYTVQVRATGYKDWTQTGVKVPVDASGCHVVTAQLQAKMVKSAP